MPFVIVAMFLTGFQLLLGVPLWLAVINSVVLPLIFTALISLYFWIKSKR